MKTTVNFYDFTEAFKAYGRENNFSYEGKKALFDYIEEFEDSTGEEIELDIIAFCCEYSEHTTLEALNYYGLTASDLGLGDELEAYRDGVVEDQMEALPDGLTAEEEEARREVYEHEAALLGLVDLLDDDADTVKDAAIEYFGERTQVIDVPGDSLILLDY